MANGIIIPDLPQGSGLSASDLLVKDTGSETQKVPVSSAYATASNPGLISTASQTIAGKKTFAENPELTGGHSFLTSNNVKIVTVGNKTIASNGYVSINDVKPSGTILAAWVRTYSSISPANSINVTGDGNFLFGTPNTTVTGLVVTYLVV